MKNEEMSLIEKLERKVAERLGRDDVIISYGYKHLTIDNKVLSPEPVSNVCSFSEYYGAAIVTEGSNDVLRLSQDELEELNVIEKLEIIVPITKTQDYIAKKDIRKYFTKHYNKNGLEQELIESTKLIKVALKLKVDQGLYIDDTDIMVACYARSMFGINDSSSHERVYSLFGNLYRGPDDVTFDICDSTAVCNAVRECEESYEGVRIAKLSKLLAEAVKMVNV